MSFQTKSLRNNPGRVNLPTLNLGTSDNGASQSLPIRTLKRKNLRGLSLQDEEEKAEGSSSTGSGLSLSIPANPSKRSSIQQVTTSSNMSVEATSGDNELEDKVSKLSIESYTGETKAQVITTKVTTSSITPQGVAADGFSLNNFNERDLLRLEDLGAGNSGSVLKVIHTPSQKTMAKKTIHIENNPSVKQQIARELKIMNECKSKYIIEFYGSFLQEGNVIICMEYMDIGSLDKVLKIKGPFPEYFINHVAYSVLNGLKYLYTQHKITHRDIKPSNVLLNSKGSLRLCDFGVSRELIGSVADTFVGTSTYMSPQRILGDNYTINGDIWSLGLMLVELATGFFPFGESEKVAPNGILDLLQRIVNEDPPTLRSFNDKWLSEHNLTAESVSQKPLFPRQYSSNVPENQPSQSTKSKPDYPFSEIFSEFVESCLIKDEAKRPYPSDLLKHTFILVYKKDLDAHDSKNLKQDIKDWCKSVKKMKKA